MFLSLNMSQKVHNVLRILSRTFSSITVAGKEEDMKKIVKKLFSKVVAYLRAIINEEKASIDAYCQQYN